MFSSVLARHTEVRHLTIRLPQLSLRRMILMLVALVVLATPLLAWGFTGADPYTLLHYAFTGQATIKEVTRYDEEGNVLSVKQVYRLGRPEALARCQALLDAPLTHDGNGHEIEPIASSVHVVQCP